MFYNNLDPILFSLGNLEIRYYGVIYALGFIIGYLFLKYFSKTRKINLNKEQLDSFLLYLILGVVIGARVFYIIFYNPLHYLNNLLEIFYFWEGGLSFHGGLVGGCLIIYLFCRRNNIKFLDMADVLSIPLSLALALGRIGNFINGELYGRITSLPWGVKFKNVEGFRHPSQIYESLKNLIIFFTLFSLKNKKLKSGFIFGLFLVMYSTLRFMIEFVREPEIYLGFLTMGQLLSTPLFIIGFYLIKRKN